MFYPPYFFLFMHRIVYTLLSQDNNRYWISEIQACNLGQFSRRCTRRTESMTGTRWIKLVNWSPMFFLLKQWVLKQEPIQHRMLFQDTTIYFCWPNQPSSCLGRELCNTKKTIENSAIQNRTVPGVKADACVSILWQKDFCEKRLKARFTPGCDHHGRHIHW